MKKLILLLLFSCGFLVSKATHNRAGEITYTWLGGLTYEVTVTTYTRIISEADRCELEIFWGDNTSDMAIRNNGPSGSCPAPAKMGEFLVNDIRKNVYTQTHSYPGPGVYTVFFEDPNRNQGVSNIPNSVNVPFYVESQIFIIPGISGNSSPILTNPPVDDGCLNTIFKHNPGAVDKDGDSLYYSLALTRTTGGAIIPTTYDTTIVKDSLRVDPATGDLIWDVPKNAGQFNFAIQIEEWRLGPPPSLRWVKVGSVTRDLQIDISSNCQNLPPEIIPVGPFCVEAGSNLNFNVTASDPDGDRVSLTAFGNPFEAPSPADAFNFSSASPVTGTFNWDTKCVHIRRQPYYVTFEAKDFPALTQSPRLTDVYTTEITVIAPAPRNPSATPNLDNINLAWSKGVCDISDTINGGYKIYRREETYGFIPSACETGVPEYTGYELVGRTKAGDTTYTDTTGLQKGIRYCYMVVSCFADAVESYASIEFCAALPLTSALLTKVDILSTDLATGSVQVEWISPPVLDTANFPPPYEYRLYRSDSINGTAFQQIQVLQGIANTSYTDANLNTQSLGYNYRVDFYSGTTASFVGSSPTSSSVYLKVKPVDQKNELDFSHNTSWRNDRFTIFRETAPGSGIFDSIAESFSPNYIDTGLTNGTTYCYRVKSTGAYTASDSLPKPLINNSQINCATPLDTNLPCTPILSYEFNCDSGYAIFYAQMPNDPTCDDQITEYRLYKKDTPQEDFTTTPIASVMSPDSSFLLLRVDLGKSLTGCYAVTAIDDAGSDPQGTANESLLSNVICIDGCPSLQFPNIFTPNADGINDFFLPINPQDITYINIKIYNRWGTSVFENGNIRFLVDGWNGTDQNTSQELADGVYYYVCQYSANTLTGPPLREVTGYVHLFKGE